MEEKDISQAVIGRLPRYYRYLKELKDAGKERISSQELSRIMKVTASQIRQDFNNFGGFGQQGYGYNTNYLYDEIGKILGLDHTHNMVLVGAGNLGQALLKNFDFEACGFFMLAAFDTDPDKVDTQVGPVHIMDGRHLKRFIETEAPSMAVLTVPRENAAEAAGVLADAGVGAIWDFTGCDLGLEGRDITVERVNLADSLLTLSYRLERRRTGEEDHSG